MTTYSTNPSYSTAQKVSISGPFNIQHIPKIKNSNLYGNNGSNQEEYFATKNSVLVCTYKFQAKFDNELSCSEGEVLKLIDPKIIDGWILVQSMVQGRSGWVPKDNLKILNLSKANNDKNLSSTTISNSTVRTNRFSHETDISDGDSTFSSLDSPNTVCTYKTTFSDKAETDTEAETESRRVQFQAPNMNRMINSIYIHSINSLYNNSKSNFWYRIDVRVNGNKSSSTLHLSRSFDDLYILHNKLKSKMVSLPQLPKAMALNNCEISLLKSLDNLNAYLGSLFNEVEKSDDLIYSIFQDFCLLRETDFEHYIDMTDNEISKILKPPMKLQLKKRSVSGKSASSVKRLSLRGPLAQTQLLFKVQHGNDFVAFKLKDISFNVLKKTIIDNFQLKKPFVMAYLNIDNVWVMIKDDSSINNALEIWKSTPKVRVKVC